VTALVLASASPRRREILTTLGVAFVVEPSDASEVALEGEAPFELVQRLASDKARSVSERRAGAFVLGADTIVVTAGRVLGKPSGVAEAAAMLRSLSGGWHEVMTGVALAKSGALVERIVTTTRVHFLPIEEIRVARYAASGEGLDKAGAYAIQGLASAFCDRIEGSYSNVVGLPAAETLALLERHGALPPWP
jgi:septum formation protein